MTLPKAGGRVAVMMASPGCTAVTSTSVVPAARTVPGTVATLGLEDVKVTGCAVAEPRLTVSGAVPPVGMIRRAGPMPVSSLTIVTVTIGRVSMNGVEVYLYSDSRTVNASSPSTNVSPTIGITIVFVVSLLKKT